MSLILYCIISAFVCALIDAYRIKNVEGEVTNIDKSWTVFWGASIGFMGYCIFHKDPQSFGIFVLEIVTFYLLYGSIRGVFYDPILNLLRKRRIDYESKTTNSKIDQKETKFKIGFWNQRCLYAATSVAFYLIYIVIP